MLVDDTGRRRRALKWASRALSVLLLLWLGVLALAALGLQPLGRMPAFGESLAGSRPPALPQRVERAAALRRPLAPAPAARTTPSAMPAASRTLPTAAQPAPRRAVSSAPVVKKRPRPASKHDKTPAVSNAGGRPAASQRPGAAAVAPGRTGTTPSGKATGGRSGIAPAKTTTVPPGQVNKTSPTATTPAAVTTPGKSGDHAGQGRGKPTATP